MTTFITLLMTCILTLLSNIQAQDKMSLKDSKGTIWGLCSKIQISEFGFKSVADCKNLLITRESDKKLAEAEVWARYLPASFEIDLSKYRKDAIVNTPEITSDLSHTVSKLETAESSPTEQIIPQQVAGLEGEIKLLEAKNRSLEDQIEALNAEKAKPLEIKEESSPKLNLILCGIILLLIANLFRKSRKVVKLDADKIDAKVQRRVRQIIESTTTRATQELNQKIERLETQVRRAAEINEKLSKENEDLKEQISGLDVYRDIVQDAANGKPTMMELVAKITKLKNEPPSLPREIPYPNMIAR